jgi:hypothetical protein
MIRSIVCVVAMLVALEARSAAPVGVRVLDGPEVQAMRDGLARVKCPCAGIASLDEASLASCRVLVLCGTRPPVPDSAKQRLTRFLDEGGAILAVGGGARRVIELGLFDAEAYYMTGTTTHNSVFDGYHRLMFGFPGAEPPSGGTTSGVSNLLRATEGPLMRLGPQATSILAAGGGYSLAALQRVGKGRLLALGADPHGGQFFTDVDRPSRRLGDQLRTDAVLANAVAYLLDPRCNLIPNPGFEELTNLPPAHSHWEVSLTRGATHEWRRSDAAQGAVCLRLGGPGAKAFAEVHPFLPIVVERGLTYTLACQYRSTAPWKVSWQSWKTAPPGAKSEAGPVTTVPASAEWKRFSTPIAVPGDVSYVRPQLQFTGQGELFLDEVTLKLR